jgi:hypothetical protein
MKAYPILVLLLFIALKSYQQKITTPYKIHFAAYDGVKKIVSNPEQYLDADSNSVGLKQLKFYISAIRLEDADGNIWKENDSYHLIEIGGANDLALPMPANFKPVACEFNVGIDSITNVSGAQTGDLDPMKGMYWTWQSGYINVKLEGIYKGNEFEYHLGGYAGQQLSLQHFTARTTANELSVQIDVADFLRKFDQKKLKHIMSPGKNAVMLSGLLIQSFKVAVND